MRISVVLFRASLATLLCVLCALPSNARQGQVELVDVPDPGNAPPLIAAEYEPYFKTGTASIIVPFMIKYRDGSLHGCEPGLSEGHLYPSTKYVRWALAKWAFLKRTNWFKPNIATTSPDKFGGFVDMPVYLTYTTTDPTAVRYAVCDQTHHVTFRNLPAGSYIFWGIVDSRIPGSGYEDHQSMGVDPQTGMLSVQTYRVPMDNSKVVDNYYLFSYEVTVKEGESFTMYQSSIKPFAYER